MSLMLKGINWALKKDDHSTGRNQNLRSLDRIRHQNTSSNRLLELI